MTSIAHTAAAISPVRLGAMSPVLAETSKVRLGAMAPAL